MARGSDRLVYQDPGNKVLSLKLRGVSESLDFVYDESIEYGGYALAAEPDTRIDCFGLFRQNPGQPVYYLQTQENNIAQYQFNNNPIVIYSG